LPELKITSTKSSPCIPCPASGKGAGGLPTLAREDVERALEVLRAHEDVEILGVPGDPGVAGIGVSAADQERSPASSKARIAAR